MWMASTLANVRICYLFDSVIILECMILCKGSKAIAIEVNLAKC